jgi:hypothetical protein
MMKTSIKKVWVTFGLIHHSVDVSCKIQMNVDGALTSLTERAGEEEVKDGFLPVIMAKDTIIVIPFKLMLFPSENISDIESIHEQEPIEDSDFVRAAGIPNPNERFWRLDIFIREMVEF